MSIKEKFLAKAQFTQTYFFQTFLEGHLLIFLCFPCLKLNSIHPKYQRFIKCFLVFKFYWF